MFLTKKRIRRENKVEGHLTTQIASVLRWHLQVGAGRTGPGLSKSLGFGTFDMLIG